MRALPSDVIRDKLMVDEIAFASLNDMRGLSKHPHLRRVTVQTSAGEAKIPAPAAIFVGEERSYGDVPDLGENGTR